MGDEIDLEASLGIKGEDAFETPEAEREFWRDYCEYMGEKSREHLLLRAKSAAKAKRDRIY
ncbi:MAG: hypothetical protein CMH64_03960 [Nanoarchaeota archaeon]|nr:hypothetical protein [Nanoarchaeota archaeon]|tara:strand:- start:255 stop:437 length:183 start_codon:yes stop_codon:yes gene_type:complete